MVKRADRITTYEPPWRLVRRRARELCREDGDDPDRKITQYFNMPDEPAWFLYRQKARQQMINLVEKGAVFAIKSDGKEEEDAQNKDGKA